MLKELLKEHTFMSCIMLIGTGSLVLQGVMALSLKGYVKASANMKTTRKKVMLNLKSQFEAIYGMDYQVRNISAYVDKYLLKLRFLGFSYSAWEKVPFLTAGLLALLAGIGMFYGYLKKAGTRMQVELLFSCGVMLVCLFVFYHIFGIKSKKEQIQIQLADYLENYLTNRLIRNRESGRQPKLMDEKMEQAVLTGTEGSFDEILKQAQKAGDASDIEEDMEMLKRLLREMDAERREREHRAEERRRKETAAFGQEEQAKHVEAEFAASYDGAGGGETGRMERSLPPEREEAVIRENADACDGYDPEESARAEGETSPEGAGRRAGKSSPEEAVRTEGETPPEETAAENGRCGESGKEQAGDAGEPEVISFEEAALRKGSRTASGIKQTSSSEQGGIKNSAGAKQPSFSEQGGSKNGAVVKQPDAALAARADHRNGVGRASVPDGKLPEPSLDEMAAAKEDAGREAFEPGEAEIELLEEFVLSFLAQAGGAS